MLVALYLNEHLKSNFYSTNFFIHFITFRMKGQGDPDEEKVASLLKQLETNLDVYEKILSKQPYLAGEVRAILSIQDII
jgi:glutathione S-transferase